VNESKEIYVYIHTYLCIHVYVYEYLCMYFCIKAVSLDPFKLASNNEGEGGDVNESKEIYVYIHTYLCVHVYVYEYLCMYFCIKAISIDPFKLPPMYIYI
jgi:hypothetical protein